MEEMFIFETHHFLALGGGGGGAEHHSKQLHVIWIGALVLEGGGVLFIL